jgi:hypothetical protein
MILYPKINTVWKRDERGRIVEGDLSLQEFSLIKEWDITEKVDGTNIRVGWNGVSVAFGGRTDRAEIPKPLLARLEEIFTPERMRYCFPLDPAECAYPIITLFGEGYGNKIQGVGSKYLPNTVNFILFDVCVNHLWLERENVEDIASKLGIKTVPFWGKMTIDEAVEFIKSKPFSTVATCAPAMVAEGIVARCSPTLLTRRGEPLMWKLKVADYEKLKANPRADSTAPPCENRASCGGCGAFASGCSHIEKEANKRGVNTDGEAMGVARAILAKERRR